MQEVIKDSAIKLFGKKIPFDLEVAWTMSDDDEDVMKETEDDGDETEQHQGPSPEDVHESDPSVSPDSGNPKTPSIDEETAKPKDSDKTLKKPDKILPCPRCKSMDTKFCYYNNYNVNQPRHFCKSCQRYWTSGGTMRNVPVGAGRRKSKSSSAAAVAAAYPQQICISGDSLHHPHHQYQNSRRNHGTVLSFSSDSRTQGTAVAAMNRNVDDSSSESTVTTTTSSNRNEELLSHPNNLNGYGVHPPPPPWPYNMAAVPFYPFWTCHVPATPWNLPWPPPPPPPPPTTTYPCSEKRFREGDDDSEREAPKKVLAPKTLRMDDPNDAAKSSIWATLGISKDGGAGVAPKGGFFKGFEKTHHIAGEGGENPSVLHCVNPAAFSRSLNFHERH